MTRALVVAAAVLAAAGAAVAGSEQVDRPSALIDKLAQAIEDGDEALARAQFTSAGFDRERDSGASFYRQAVAKQFELRVPSVIELNDRAVITVDVARSGKVADRVFFYAIRDGARRWRIGAVNENKYFGDAFLGKRIGVDFDVRVLPASPTLDALAAAMIDAGRGRAAARRRIETDVVAAGRDDALAKLAALKHATFVSSHVAADLGCAALHFRARPPSVGAYSETLSFVLIQRDRRWEIAHAGYGAPSTTDMLRAWTRDRQATAAPVKSTPAVSRVETVSNSESTTTVVGTTTTTTLTMTTMPVPPIPAGGTPGMRYLQIAAGEGHTCARSNKGDVICWGANQFGQVDPKLPAGPVNKPVRVPGLTDVVAIAAGDLHTCALRSRGGIVCWGGTGPMLGRAPGGGAGNDRAAIEPCPAPCPAAPHALAVGGMHACAAFGDAIACWGANDRNQVGASALDPQSLPVRVASGRITRFALGSAHSCALTAAAEVVCWGDNFHAQRGDYDLFKGPAREKPVAIAGFKGAIDIAAGNRHTCALDGAGAVRCVGHSNLCQLGRQGRADVPALVPAVTGAATISARSFSTCAVLRTGGVTCWGSNDSGELGTGRVQALREAAGTDCTPTAVSSLTDAVQVSVGASHACALRRGGEVVCWGSNKLGQLGDGTGTNRSTPVAVNLP